jgi:hypothetical protein
MTSSVPGSCHPRLASGHGPLGGFLSQAYQACSLFTMGTDPPSAAAGGLCQHFAYSMFNACPHGYWPTDDKGVARMDPSRQDDLLDGKRLRLLNGQREGMA